MTIQAWLEELSRLPLGTWVRAHVKTDDGSEHDVAGQLIAPQGENCVARIKTPSLPGAFPIYDYYEVLSLTVGEGA